MGLKRTDEFRQDAARIALTSGLTRKQVASDLGVGLSTLNKRITASENPTTGMRDFAIKDNNARKLEGTLWYPASPDARVKRQHSNGVWVGVDVAKKGEPIEGTFPLVVLSHGMYGKARNQNWLAHDLVQQGYIAVTLNHPGTSTWLREVDDARQIWERPKDVSRTISYLLESHDLGVQIDPNRVYVAGHSLGGMTTVQLAGGRYAPEQIDEICKSDPSELICELTEMWQLGQTQQDREAMSQDLRDPRIKAVAVLDLGGTQTFSPESLAAITTPMLVIGAPKDVQESLDLDRESRKLVSMLPEETTTYMEPASLSHFDFLGTCTEKAIPILEDEVPGDGYICFDGTQERTEDHAIVSSALIDFFAKH